jgi:hypothetical protein
MKSIGVASKRGLEIFPSPFLIGESSTTWNRQGSQHEQNAYLQFSWNFMLSSMAMGLSDHDPGLGGVKAG